jgi:ribonuclease HII
MTLKTIISGIDDATKCPCIGSIFIAGVSATPLTIQKWAAIGVADSKMLTRKKREKLAPLIRDTAEAFVIDEVRPEAMADQSLNLNDREMEAVLSIMSRLPLTSGKVYIDNWEVSQEWFFKRLTRIIEMKGPEVEQRLKNLCIIPEHRADENHTIVGAASILAKVSSDAQYDEYRQKYGDFGSGSPADPKTRLFVWEHRSSPPPIIRTTWQTYKHLSSLDNIKDDFLYSRVKKKPIKKG